jgi:hypothetical protein
MLPWVHANKKTPSLCINTQQKYVDWPHEIGIVESIMGIVSLSYFIFEILKTFMISIKGQNATSETMSMS